MGESTTSIIQGPIRTRTLAMRSDHQEAWPHGTICCTRIVYRTVYHRFWIPNVTQSIYQVDMIVPEEVRNRHPIDFFAPAVYPLLCSSWLIWTTYPHICAIQAYLDTLLARLRAYDDQAPASPTKGQ